MITWTAIGWDVSPPTRTRNYARISWRGVMSNGVIQQDTIRVYKTTCKKTFDEVIEFCLDVQRHVLRLANERQERDLPPHTDTPDTRIVDSSFSLAS